MKLVQRLFLLACSLPIGAIATSAAPPSGPRWSASWAAAPQALADLPTFAAPPGAPGSDQVLGDRSFRQRLFSTLSGTELRVRFSNQFGNEPLTLQGASIGRSTGSEAVSPASLKRLRFKGRDGVTIAPGQVVWSDAMRFRVGAGDALAVSFKAAPSTPLATVHKLPSEPSWVVDGDAVMRPGWQGARAFPWNQVLTGLDVATASPARVVVAFGDSLTAGAGADESAALPMRYPDRLAALLRARPGAPQVAVINSGISGNRLLADNIGPRGLDRFDRDVLGQSGVTHALILIGINDIGFGMPAAAPSAPGPAAPLPLTPSAEQLTRGLQSLVDRCRERGVKVLLGTLMPFKGAAYWSADKESRRQAVNRWIRGRQDIDAVVDFDLATRNPADPATLLPAYDSGDHLHPSNAGYAAMAGAIELKELLE
ncbi:Lysophospholipase L1 [Burkholderiales bacterium 8X]|nr:Lysophospholipase L1 [Burkholderiales bacterium 8X]